MSEHQHGPEQAAPGLVDFFENLFKADFMPHGHCYLWQKDILWLHVFSDTVIAIAYYAIPVILFYFVQRRKDIPFNWMFLMFACFIVACGTTHLLGIITVWNGAYRIEGVVKFATALMSIATAIALFPILPKALSLPSQVVLNQKYKQKSKDLEAINSELEKFNKYAVGREERIMELKSEVNSLLEKLGESKKYN